MGDEVQVTPPFRLSRHGIVAACRQKFTHEQLGVAGPGSDCSAFLIVAGFCAVLQALLPFTSLEVEVCIKL